MLVNGTSYHDDTDRQVISWLENLRATRERVILDYGDKETGKSSGDVYETVGYIGRSSGEIKVPLLVHNRRSMGGGPILTANILRILSTKGKRVIYQHPNYKE